MDPIVIVVNIEGKHTFLVYGRAKTWENVICRRIKSILSSRLTKLSYLECRFGLWNDEYEFSVHYENLQFLIYDAHYALNLCTQQVHTEVFVYNILTTIKKDRK